MSIRGIRGATTVRNNDRVEILDETRNLLEKIIEKNHIKIEDISSILFSVTRDLDAVYPAVAARELGITHAALMCSNEMYVPGSLQKCIRIMLHVNTDLAQREVMHVYLKDATVLRPDLAEITRIKIVDRINIAIDGPAGAGKSTAAKALAKKLGIIYIDTGAMYRSVALKAIRKDIDTKDRAELANLVKDIDIKISHNNGEQEIYLDGENVSKLIRTPEVSVGASNVAVIPEVRLKLVELQREIAGKHSVVMDGRDIGTYVLPDAKCKIFLTASEEERAMRRYKEMIEKGMQGLNLEDIRKDIHYRDMNDSSREFAPLAIASDAVVIDSTGMSLEEVLDKIINVVNNAK